MTSGYGFGGFGFSPLAGSVTIGDVYTPADEPAMLALPASQGDVAIRADINRTFILSSNDPTELADWKVLYAAGDVLSVAGKTGVVTLDTADVSGAVAGPVSSTAYAITRFSGTTGKLIQNSSVTVDDAGKIGGKAANFILPGDDNITIDGRTNPRTITLGVLRINHTAGATGTRPIHIDVDTAGFGDTHILDGTLTTTGLSAGDECHALDVHVDSADSTGGEVHVLAVAKTGTGGVNVTAVEAYGAVNVFRQAAAPSPASLGFAWSNDSSVFTDRTAAFGGGTNVQLFPANADAVYVGHSVAFTALEVVLAVVASGAGVKPTFAYSDGAGGWTAFVPSDGTNGFRANGVISWATLTGWAQDTVNGQGGLFWVRITRTQNTLTTPPTEATIKAVVSSEFGWDSDGAVTAKSLALAGEKITGLANGTASTDAATKGQLDTDLAGKVAKSTLDANTILKADSDDTPSALTVDASTIVGRKATGGIAALTGAEVAALLSGISPSAVTGTAAILGANTFTGAQTIAVSGTEPLTLQRTDIGGPFHLVIKNSAGTTLGRFGEASTGQARILAKDHESGAGTHSYISMDGGVVYVRGRTDAANVLLATIGMAAQTGNHFEARNSAGTVLASINAAGSVTCNTINGQLLYSTSVNAGLGSWHVNTNANNATHAWLGVGNAVDQGAMLASMCYGTGWTTSGLAIQDAGRLTTGTALSGGLVVDTQAAAPLIFGTNNTERFRWDSAGLATLWDGGNIAVGSSTGTTIATASTQKLGFWGAAAAVQPTAVADATDAPTVITQLNALLARLRTLGLIAT